RLLLGQLRGAQGADDEPSGGGEGEGEDGEGDHHLDEPEPVVTLEPVVTPVTAVDDSVTWARSGWSGHLSRSGQPVCLTRGFMTGDSAGTTSVSSAVGRRNLNDSLTDIPYGQRRPIGP